MVTVCARHGAQHDCLNDRAGVACELWLPGDGPTGDGDGDLEAAVYAIESTAHAELEDEEPSDYYVSEPAIDIDDPVTRGVLDAIARDRGFSRDRGPSDTPPCPVSLSPIPIRADGGR